MGKKSPNQDWGSFISSRWSTKKSIVSTIVAIVVCVALFIWLNSLDLTLVHKVKNAYPNEYPNITFEEAFGRYYSNAGWENASTDSAKIVRFTGDCTYRGEDVNVVFDFEVKGSELRLLGGTVNGETASETDLENLISWPFKQYGK